MLAVSDADRGSLGAQLADRVVCIGPAAPAESYLDVDRVVAAAKVTGCDALHPGYGFLSERAELSAACEEAGDRLRRALRGGDAPQRRQGDGARRSPRARRRRSTRAPTSIEHARRRRARSPPRSATRSCSRRRPAAAAAGCACVESRGRARRRLGARRTARPRRPSATGALFVERYVRHARHVEVQVLGDGRGRRDPRRPPRLHAAAPLPEADRGGAGARPPGRARRARSRDAAVRLIAALDYAGAATCEFLVDPERGTAGFLEINARLQVEHPVTEMVTGVDIVREQLRIAGGEALSVSPGRGRDPRPRDRGADQRRVPRARLRAVARARSPLGAAAGHRRARRHRLLPRLDDRRPTTTRCWRS